MDTDASPSEAKSYWFKDTPERIAQATADGYRVVLNGDSQQPRRLHAIGAVLMTKAEGQPAAAS